MSTFWSAMRIKLQVITAVRLWRLSDFVVEISWRINDFARRMWRVADFFERLSTWFSEWGCAVLAGKSTSGLRP